MLRDGEVRIDLGRASHGGDFLRMVHEPTGISRYHPGPLRDLNQDEWLKQMAKEIQAELKERGLDEYLVPDPDPKK